MTSLRCRISSVGKGWLLFVLEGASGPTLITGGVDAGGGFPTLSCAALACSTCPATAVASTLSDEPGADADTSALEAAADDATSDVSAARDAARVARDAARGVAAALVGSDSVAPSSSAISISAASAVHVSACS